MLVRSGNPQSPKARTLPDELRPLDTGNCIQGGLKAGDWVIHGTFRESLILRVYPDQCYFWSKRFGLWDDVTWRASHYLNPLQRS